MISMYVGQQLEVDIFLLDALNTPTLGERFDMGPRWKSSDSKVLSVQPTKTYRTAYLQANSIGSATVTISYQLPYRGRKLRRYHIQVWGKIKGGKKCY